MDRAGLITLEQARAAGLSFDEPEPRTCPHCGAALDPLGAALAGKVAIDFPVSGKQTVFSIFFNETFYIIDRII